MNKIVKCFVEFAVFCVVMLCSNIFVVILPINPCHKILEKFLIVALIVYVNLGKFRIVRVCA